MRDPRLRYVVEPAVACGWSWEPQWSQNGSMACRVIPQLWQVTKSSVPHAGQVYAGSWSCSEAEGLARINFLMLRRVQ